MPTAKMVLLDGTGMSRETVRLEVVERIENGWGAEPMKENDE